MELPDSSEYTGLHRVLMYVYIYVIAVMQDLLQSHRFHDVVSVLDASYFYDLI